MVGVVLRQAVRTIGLGLDPADAFARSLEAALRRRLPAGWSLLPGGADLVCERLPDGDWRICIGRGVVSTDDLAFGAAAARHLSALGARELRYAGPAGEGLRWRGFAIAAGAIGCHAGRLPALPAEGLVGIFADGAAAEGEAMRRLAAAGRSVPRDALLLGVEDGRLPAPCTPGLSRLRLDPERLAAACLAMLSTPAAERLHVQPSGVITRASSDASGGDQRLAAVLAHIAANLHRPLGVDGLARAGGMPRRSLERLFRTVLGRSPLDEIVRQRIARAQELLVASDMPLADIAQRVGLSGADRLGVVFRQVVGTSPGAWRRQNRT